jgi:tRNA pseudouridine55 synthase
VANDLHGYLNVLKPPGWTSHDVVARLRRLTGQRRIGHTGTLDPAAVGVLPVALGRATRTTSSATWDRKLYLGDISFGTATDTDDAMGNVIATAPTEHLDLDSCIASLRGLVGDVQQRPPVYSAVHVDGRRAYAQARKGARGELPPRPVRIDAISMVAWQPPVASLIIQCRSGTYIRSIARDLGAAMGTAAHLNALVRLRVGPFAISEAIGLDRCADLAAASKWSQVLWPADVAAFDLGAIVVGRERADDLGHGRSWKGPEQVDDQSAKDRKEDGFVRVYDLDGDFLALAERVGSAWQPRLAIPVQALTAAVADGA